jgi:hypothetical protein
LVVVLAAIYVPMGLFATFSDISPNRAVNSPDVATIPAMQIALFAAAVMMTCLVRQAVYAAILSIAVVYVGVLVTLGAWWVVGFLGFIPFDRTAWWEPTATQIATGLVATIFVCAVIAWLATRNDWGRKSRY